MLLGFGSNNVFILVSTDVEVLGYNIGVPDVFIVGDYELGRIGSLVGSYEYLNDGNTVVSILGESLGSYEGSVFCSSDGFFDGTKYGIFIGWIFWLLLWFTDGLALGSDVGFILVSTDVEVLGYTDRIPYGLIFDTDEKIDMGSLVGSSDVYNDGSTMCSLLGESLWSDGGVALCSSEGFFDGTKDGIFVGWIICVLLGFSYWFVFG